MHGLQALSLSICTGHMLNYGHPCALMCLVHPECFPCMSAEVCSMLVVTHQQPAALALPTVCHPAFQSRHNDALMLASQLCRQAGTAVSTHPALLGLVQAIDF